MNKENLASVIGTMTMTIVDAMKKIDDNGKGILFIVDENQALEGCITDGDIRRWILKSANLNATVECAMVYNPQFLRVEEKKHAEDLMHEKVITAIPLVDENKVIQDIVFLSDYNGMHDNKDKKNLSNIPVIIMAGGKGTRLYPYTKILPKPLIPIGETPIIERIINCFTEYKIDSFYITVNYKKSMIKSYFADIETNYTIKYVEEDKPLGTCGSIKLINETLKDSVIIANCDALILADYGDIYEHHMKTNNDITVVSALKNVTVPYGVLNTKEDGEIISMEEKPHLSYLINTGMYIIKPDVISYVPENTMFHMTDLINVVMKNGGKVGMYPISEDSFLDMGEFGEMKRMEEKLNIVLD
ncbi:MAG: nucleotidyltransferase family protein [Thermoflexaceae bacterium]|nr:nucleotidyltransferase family protein [Thermoflexaceae bacterium]